MDQRYVLMEDDKEKLVDEILDLRQRNNDLASKIDKLRQENEALKKKQADQKTKPHFIKTSLRQKGRPRFGQKPGHVGYGRKRPVQIDEDVEQRLEACPDCDYRLGQSLGTSDHVTEDIVPPRVHVTRFRHHRYWCGHCQRIISAPASAREVPQGRFGPLALAWMAVLKYHHGLPFNKIQSLFEDFCGLSLSKGAMAQGLQRLAHYLKIETDAIVKALRDKDYKHMDETGWKINGRAHWLWALVHPQAAYFHIHKSRGRTVAQDLLGESPQGTIISDFYSAYNRIKMPQQKCLVHLMREIHHHQGQDPPKDFTAPQKKLNRLLQDAFRLDERRPTLSALVITRRIRRLKHRLFLWATETYSHKFWQRISKRLLKHQNHLFTFLDQPGLPWHNNAAERAIRPHVIIRNRSFHSRSDKGAQAHATLTSFLESLRLNKKNFLSLLQSTYLQRRQGKKPTPVFSQI